MVTACQHCHPVPEELYEVETQPRGPVTVPSGRSLPEPTANGETIFLASALTFLGVDVYPWIGFRWPSPNLSALSGAVNRSESVALSKRISA